jgi:beta-glucosidase
MRPVRIFFLVPLLGGLLASCRSFPLDMGPFYLNSTLPVETRVADLLGRMSIEEKVGQMTMAGAAFLAQPSDITKLGLGSLLEGGDDMPPQNDPEGWADAFDGWQKRALASRLAVPLLLGVDSVHGFGHATGTTIFPHNIGLGATGDPRLVEEIGRVTAMEMAGAGARWNFSPCLAVARNERWGRTYESFGESPDLVSRMAVIIRGLQGESLALPTSVLATAKHFLGDGGTTGGTDRGDTQVDEPTLRSLYLPPYKAALALGVQSVMISFSSWNGLQMHANRRLITEVLKQEMGFDGIVVSDWDAVTLLPGSFTEQVRAAVNAGIDVFMVPTDYTLFITTLLGEVRAGRVPAARIDDAVRRILRVKFRMGLFEHPLAARQLLTEVGSAEHRALARSAVQESMVLLKNEGHILPLSRMTQRILVVGKNADDLGNQLGGWSITWQGGSGPVTDGTTILQGIRAAVSPGSTVVFDPQGLNASEGFDVAIAVIGETPYAETFGDRPGSLGLDAQDLAVLARLQAARVPVVTVIVSGRPLIITDQIAGWKALLEAWLPGTEGGGVADVLFGSYAPTGRLPITWPRSETQIPVNVGDAQYAPLFPYGYGLTY